MSRIIPINPVVQNVTESVSDTSNSKDWAMVKTMASLARTAPQKNLTTVEINNVTRTTRLAMILLPEWGVYYPPYNMARLTAVARGAGYHVDAYDLNIECYNEIRSQMDFDPWDPSREFLWEQTLTYFTQIHKFCEPVYNRYIEQIVASKPDVIGFTLYYTNEECTQWMARKLRRLLPDVKLVIGGPQASSPKRGTAEIFDYVVQGEGEQLLLTILDSVENKAPLANKVLVQPKTERLNLDQLPFPDYTDYDFNKYTTPNGISSEISRGCVAKCVFCTEVHFWKYRGRQAGSILDEVIYQNSAHGVDFVWFIDSLVNGNLNELRAFALGVVENNLKIRWQGYARCDSRMDAEYYRDLAASGCHMLNYGIESGSQRVLDAMKKNITVEAIENNLRDAAAAGILSSSNWIIGFPSEGIQDFADTLTILYRIRNNRLINFSPGISMMMSPGAEVTDNYSKFGISDKHFEGAWTTNDLLNTKLHRMIRQKCFQIFAQHLNPKEKIYGTDRDTLLKMYDIAYDKKNQVDTIPYEKFDYNIISSGISVFADSAMNEIWPLLRNFWRALGAYTIEVRHSPVEDLAEWGFRLACNYTATHRFSIDTQGNWTADFDYKFVQDPNNQQWGDNSFEYKFVSKGNWP
jgi:hypothetical protein